LKKYRKKQYTVEEFVQGIVEGNRIVLSQAITMIESSLPEHQTMAQKIIEKCMPDTGHSLRIGITGVPGVGKSTFIESFGLHLVNEGRKLAVLAIDPSSERSRGSILGDKTRMEQLSAHPSSFIRPSPSSGSLGGVARKTRETIFLCEAAGFDTILVETVGVGQSETAVHSMVDFFLLLMLAGAGDELQGIKRGIMEMADMVAITKADGVNTQKARQAMHEYQNALHLYPPSPSRWITRVITCSALENKGITELWGACLDYFRTTKANGYFQTKRKEQAVYAMYQTVWQNLQTGFYHHPGMKEKLRSIEKEVAAHHLSPYQAASQLLEIYLKNKK
jgi:GTPase